MSPSRDHSTNRVSRSRPRNSRTPSVASIPYLPQAESLILPDGAVGEEATELLQDLVYPRRETLIDEEEEDSPTDNETDNEHATRINLPWWKRPSPLWSV